LSDRNPISHSHSRDSERKVRLVLTRFELAKYPFVLDAAEEVKRLDLNIENLENPGLKSILDRAQNRIEEALKYNPPQVSYHPREEDIEIPSFPVAIILTAATNNDYIKRRYALAEARRAYELLREEDKNKLMEVAQVFNWKIRSPSRSVAYRKFDFALHFTDFLRNARSFHEEGWKLVNKVLLDGEVYLGKREAARLLQEEIRGRIEQRLNANVRPMLPEIVLQLVDALSQKYAYRAEKTRFAEFPEVIVNAAFPPCVNQLHASAESGRHVSHLGRFTLTSFLLSVGMKPTEVVSLFRPSSDFSERIARYQVEHIAGQRGSRTKYRPPTCETLKTHGLCPGPDELCRTIRHPLSYYGKKTRMLKKEVSAN
jgi:DNA primase large subunit